MPRPAPSRVAAALDYLERLKNQAAEFGGGVVENLADRARSVGGLAYEALATDPNMGRMTTAEFAQAADRPTPRLDQAARDIGTIGRAIVTQPVETGKAIVQGEVERAREAMSSPRAAGQYAGSFIDPMRIAAALRRTAPVLELDVYHGTPHRFPATEANPLGEFDASKIGTGEGAQAYGHGIYYAENPDVASGYKSKLSASSYIKDSAPVDSGVIWHKAADAALEIGKLHPDNAGQISSQIMDWVDGGRKPETFLKFNKVSPQLQPAYEAAIKEYVGAIKNKGSLYKADLPDEMIDRMLDWDKPLSEQSAVVREALMPIVKAAMKKRGTPDRALEYSANRAIGGDIVKDLLVGNGVTRADVSRIMQEAGIPGIRYLDAGSRGQGGSGTRNFVVFPGEEKKVKILERNGQPAPERIAQALEAAPSKAAKVEPQPFGLQGYLDDDLRRVKQNFFSQYGLEEGKQFSKDYEVIELSKLKPTENTNESKIQSLMKTMREEGNAKNNPIPPIIVDSEGNILDGHHRYEAAKRLGAKYVPVVELFDKQKGSSFSE